MNDIYFLLLDFNYILMNKKIIKNIKFIKKINKIKKNL